MEFQLIFPGYRLNLRIVFISNLFVKPLENLSHTLYDIHFVVQCNPNKATYTSDQ